MLPHHQAAPQADRPKRSASRLERAVEFLLDPIVLLTVVHLSILALGLPLLARLPGWFPRLGPKPLGPWYLLLGLCAVPVLGWLRGEPGRVDFGADSFRVRTPTRFRVE